MKKPSQKRKKRGSRRRSQSQSTPKLKPVPDSGSNVSKVKEDTREITPTPTKVAKKEPEKKKTEKTSIFKFVNISVQFLREAKIVVALYLGLIDFGLIKIIKRVIG